MWKLIKVVWAFLSVWQSPPSLFYKVEPKYSIKHPLDNYDAFSDECGRLYMLSLNLSSLVWHPFLRLLSFVDWGKVCCCSCQHYWFGIRGRLLEGEVRVAQRPALLLPSLDPQLPGSCPTNQTMGTIGNGKGLKIGLNKKMKQFFLCMIQDTL